MIKNNIITENITLGNGAEISIESGKLARQSHGSIVLRQGKMLMLATAVSNKTGKTDMDFMPLTVDYIEKFAGVGRFPGGFLKREGRPSEREILVARLIDRALRPLFPSDYHAETQVLVYLMSADEDIQPDALACFAASCAISVSDIPFNGPVSETRVGRIDGKLQINPLKSEMENSDIDIIVSATSKHINMVEGEMKEVSEADMLEAMKFGHDSIKLQCELQNRLTAKSKRANGVREYDHEDKDEELRKNIIDACSADVYKVAKMGSEKSERKEKFAEIFDNYCAKFEDDESFNKKLAYKYFHEAEYNEMRRMILEDGQRLDGRKMDEIRPIACEIDYLPSAHGSSLFTRGETQSLSTVTLGSKMDQKLLDSPMESGYSKLLLHYNFPPFSVGEARFLRGVSRREIGHGNLALRGLKGMLPEDSAYTIRIVSEILESNGSSSMATVCAGSMALMDAGIKMKKPVSGIAMGLITDDSGKFAILSDILGDEDHLGDMDFKVIGTEDGILACQMDIKIGGVTYEMLEKAMNQAKAGRIHILGEMSNAVTVAREDLKPHVPRIEKIIVDKEFIGAIIGKGGEVIKGLQEETGATISIEEVDDNGIVEISSPDLASIEAARAIIQGIITVPEVGEIYKGKVKNIMDFGAFVEILPGKDGLLHISEISWDRVPTMEGVFKEGEEIEVKLIEVDQRSGKLRLSKKVLTPKPEGYVEPAPREKREHKPRRNGGNFKRRRD